MFPKHRRYDMTVTPFQLNEAMHLYNRLSKLKPSAILEKEPSEPRDVVNVSAEAKKRQILDQARTEVLDQIRHTK
jgi:hypothetical protein